MNIKIVFLYTELAGYFLSCIKSLAHQHNVEIHIFRWPINKEAPFEFEFPQEVRVYNKMDFSRQELINLVKQLAPKLMFCSGWVDKDYLAVVEGFHKKVPILVGLDNHWNGSYKQQVARLIAPFTLQRLFTHAFVPGAPQAIYARKLWFSEDKILKGYYSADVTYYQEHYIANSCAKASAYPKRFIYVGRYVEQKGVKELWEAFMELQIEMPNDWELWCLGTGALEKIAPAHAKIKHFGFVQPMQMADFVSQAGVFVLPSHFEPWGVVVHEFAAAGFPLICSRSVGAATAFLEEGINGYTFAAGNMPALKEVMKKIISLPVSELLNMGSKSAEKALKITPEKWSSTILKVIEESKEK